MGLLIDEPHRDRNLRSDRKEHKAHQRIREPGPVRMQHRPRELPELVDMIWSEPLEMRDEPGQVAQKRRGC